MKQQQQQQQKNPHWLKMWLCLAAAVCVLYMCICVNTGVEPAQTQAAIYGAKREWSNCVKAHGTDETCACVSLTLGVLWVWACVYVCNCVVWGGSIRAHERTWPQPSGKNNDRIKTSRKSPLTLLHFAPRCERLAHDRSPAGRDVVRHQDAVLQRRRREWLQ